jgi:hypothetical protein
MAGKAPFYREIVMPVSGRRFAPLPASACSRSMPVKPA